MPLPINIEDLLRGQRIESERIEFKEGWNPTKIYQSICAFANDFDNIGGGYILVGVREENGCAVRPVVGIPEGQLDKIQQAMVGFNHKIDPYYQPRISVEEVDEKRILAIWVPSGVNRPYNVFDNVLSRDARPKWYVRYGASTIEARGEVLEELREMANRVPFDERGNPEITIEHLSPILVMDYLRRVRSKVNVDFRDTTMEILAEHLDLYTGPRERRLLKNVAAMMFCEDNAQFFPRTQVDIVLFPEGRIKNPNNFTEITPIKGSIPQIIQSTLNYLRTNVVKERIIKPKDKAESIRFFNYPYQAIEEAVVNALYHRDYQVREPVEIVLEPHAITILSYAGPDRSITREVLKAAILFKARRYRNRRLGDFLKELELSEGRSTGIPTIQNEMRKNGSPAAIVETDDDRSFFLITLPVHPDFIEEKVVFLQDDPLNDSLNDSLNDPLNDPLNERQRKIVEYIGSSPKHTYNSIASSTGYTQVTVKREIKYLESIGVLQRVGSKKTGNWILCSTHS